MPAHEAESRPCPLAVDDETLADLHDRIRRTRWTDSIAGAGWSHGTSIAYLRELAAYWVDGFDWRAQERMLNERLPGWVVEIDGRSVHYARCPGVGPDPMPLVLLHGWPGSYAEMYKIAPQLADPAAHGGDPADAFDVIVPSLPGHGLSEAVLEPGFGADECSDVVRTLMVDVLGSAVVRRAGRRPRRVRVGGARPSPRRRRDRHPPQPRDGDPRHRRRDDRRRTAVARRPAELVRRRGRLHRDPGHAPADARVRAQRLTRRAARVDRREVARVERLPRRHRVVLHQGRAADERDDLLGHADDPLVDALLLRAPRATRRSRCARSASTCPPAWRCSRPRSCACRAKRWRASTTCASGPTCRSAVTSPRWSSPTRSSRTSGASSARCARVELQLTLRNVLWSVCANGSSNSFILSIVVSWYDQLPSSLMSMVTV